MYLGLRFRDGKEEYDDFFGALRYELQCNQVTRIERLIIFLCACAKRFSDRTGKTIDRNIFRSILIPML
jgi:hypothetical protein